MGKIKTRLIKRTAKTLVKNPELNFSEDFKKNKKILGKEMPSKKVRNQIAGYISRIKKTEKIKQEKIEKSVKAVSKK
ncbi:30S ribosomal protein S17e [Candidatus Pacearchaeota archaeon]|nr:MAG: 30S ribosomal protein S17e [Candidatus Pacearchaeota archaeon]